MEGVYVVSPTEESVELIKRDFKSNSEALYRKVHLFFLQAVPRELMNSLKQCPALISRIKTFKVQRVHICVLNSTCSWSCSMTLLLLYPP